MKGIFEWVRWRRISVVIFLLAAAGMFFSLRFSGYFYRLYIMNSYGGEAVDGNTIYFFVREPEVDRLDLSELEAGDIIRDATLLMHSPSTGSEYCVLYTCGEKDIFGGKYFCGWDFTTGEAGCVVGSMAAKRYSDGEVCLESGVYPILAVREENFLVGVNQAVFYTDSRLNEVPAHEIFAVASLKKSAVYDSYEQLEQYFGGKGITLKKVTFSTVTLQNFLSYNDGFVLAVFGYAVLLLAVHILFFVYWWQHKRMWRKVMRLFGLQGVEFRTLAVFAVILAAADLAGGLLYGIVTEKLYFMWEAVFAGAGAVLFIQLLTVFFGGLCGRLWGKEHSDRLA